MHFLPPCSFRILQKDLFVSKVEPTSPRNERKFSAATAPSMKTKWLKAFKSLKPAGSGSAQQADRWVRRFYHPIPAHSTPFDSSTQPFLTTHPLPPFSRCYTTIGHRARPIKSNTNRAREYLVSVAWVGAQEDPPDTKWNSAANCRIAVEGG